jgi:hypothetical protein
LLNSAFLSCVHFNSVLVSPRLIPEHGMCAGEQRAKDLLTRSLNSAGVSCVHLQSGVRLSAPDGGEVAVPILRERRKGVNGVPQSFDAAHLQSVDDTLSNNHDAAGIVAETPKCVGKRVAGVAADSPAAAQKEKFQISGFSSQKISLQTPKICYLLSVIRHLLSDNRYLCTLY